MNIKVVVFLFLQDCFTFMDRGFVFRLINMYMDNFMPGDPKVIEYSTLYQFYC